MILIQYQLICVTVKTKNGQLTTSVDLKNLLENFDLTKSHLFFDRSVEGKGDNQKVSKKAIAEKGTNY